MTVGQDPMDAVRRYFGSLDDGDFEGVVECFTEDVFYSHPAFLSEPPGSPRHELTGRAALRAYLAQRGFRTSRHRLDAEAVAGNKGFISGVTLDEDGRPRASFVAEMIFADGLIRSYAAYISLPPVGPGFGRT
jgi:ketosteroid isomerase-like protein